MDQFSPKIEIISHFDKMINQMDIETEECLVKWNQEQTIVDLERIQNKRYFTIPLGFHLSFFTSSLD